VTVKWSRRALSDVAGIYAYVAADNEAAAVRMADRLYAAGGSLANLPQRGRPGRITGYRELVVDSYILTYRVFREEVRIVSVSHGAQRR
jgi:addiction module RelE/StbE family toxin